ncbi:MAG: lysophospholipid acyltransferase family protein, partial [Desulfohalobiaceae bacterium]|nr:lysophospholipid acyltransferase family protein [Desulfohalobiaceae bacterium]
MSKKKFTRFFYRFVLPYGGLVLVRAVSLTYRVGVVAPEHEAKALNEFKGLIYASWHQRFFAGITLFSKKKPIAIMVSQSRDGEYIAKISEILGWRAVRGSSSRGGSSALRELKRLVGQGYKVGHIVDGPRGPFGCVKPGLIGMAQATGIPILPVAISPEKAWVFNSWDRFMVPKPFSRIVLRYAEPVKVPRRLSREEFENKRA